MHSKTQKTVRTLTFATVLALLAPLKAHAYYSTFDTGEVIAPQTYQVGLAPQYITNRYEGGQVDGFFDAGIDESSSARGIIGAGIVNFELGGMYKYVPFPDAGRQPAIGGEVGAVVARTSIGTEVSLRASPMVSKRLESEVGDFIPYASLPLGITFRPDRTVVPIQLEIGTEFRPLNIPNLSGFAEIGIDMMDAFGYAGVAVAWRFDDSSIRLKPRKRSSAVQSTPAS